MNNKFEFNKIEWKIDNISDVISTFTDKLSDLKDQITSKVDELLEKAFGIKLFEEKEVKKETKENLDDLKTETNTSLIDKFKNKLSTFWESLKKDSGLSAELVSEEENKINALLEDKNTKDLAETTKQIEKDNEEIKKQLDMVSDVDLEEIDKIWKKLPKKSPLSPIQIWSVSKKHDIPVHWVLSIVENDSTYGTAWLAIETHNPGNVGNTDDGSTRYFATRYQGLNKVADNLSYRRDEFKREYPNEEPTLQQLAENRWPDGKWFMKKQANYKQPNNYRKKWWVDKAPYGAYMTAYNWPKHVAKYAAERENYLS